MSRVKYFLVITTFLALAGCSKTQAQTNSLTLASWNVQTFFDGQTDGTEYSDFQGGGKWSKDKYITRLHRLCDVMHAINADVFVFEEIENESVIYDISNQLAGDSWNKANRWYYACFAKTPGTAIGCAVFSKYPLSMLKVHSTDIRVQKEKQPSARPLLQVTVNVNGTPLTLFVSHWKSKSGGEEDSEIWRDWQESVLGYTLLNEAPQAAVLCGDFNRDAGDFVTSFGGSENKKNTIFRITGKSITQAEVYNPWFSADGTYVTDTGSYYYNEKWERIDNIFTWGNVKITSFGPRAEEPWANEQNIPVGYKQYTGEGYSDHLPLVCTLYLGN